MQTKRKLSELDADRISKSGIIIIKSQAQRSQLRNKISALNRLNDLVISVQLPTKTRIPNKPSKTAKQARLTDKKHISEKKRLRSQSVLDDKR